MAVPAPAVSQEQRRLFSEADRGLRLMLRDVMESKAEAIQNGDLREAARLLRSIRRRMAVLDENIGSLIHEL